MSLHLEPRHLSILENIIQKYDYSLFAFGSRVKGNNKKLSDIDLFYFEEIPNNIIIKLEDEFDESDLPFKVDLIDYHRCDDDFQKVMLQNYICIHVSSKLKIIEQTHVSHFTFLSKNLKGDMQEVDGVIIINSNLNSSMFNIAYGTPKSLKLSDSIQIIKKTFDRKQFAWWVPPSQHNQEVERSLLENGLFTKTTEHAMICDLSKIDIFEQKTNLLIRNVTDKILLEDFISVLEPYSTSAGKFYEKLDIELPRSQEKFFIGYDADKPVTIGALCVLGNNVGIFSLITSNDTQSKDSETNMIHFLMKTAKEHNCQLISLSASSDSGYRAYERLGFHKIGEFECFEYKDGTN